MLFKKSYFILFLLLISCSGEVSDENKQTSTTVLPVSGQFFDGVSYKTISTEKIVKDEKSPLGEWTLSVSYPEIKGGIKDKVKSKINNSITILSNKYKCPKKGEHTFTANVKFISNKVYSLNYEAMWYCPPMASPDGTSNALTFNLNTGENILLETQYINTKAHDLLSSLILRKIKTQLKDSENCPIKEQFDYFYKVKDALIFVFKMEQHADSGCISEIKVSKNELENILMPDSFLLN